MFTHVDFFLTAAPRALFCLFCSYALHNDGKPQERAVRVIVGTSAGTQPCQGREREKLSWVVLYLSSCPCFYVSTFDFKTADS